MQTIMANAKLAIFDLDGVLVNTAPIHTMCFREAVEHYVPIQPGDEALFDASDGVRTITKLRSLQQKYGITDCDVKRIDFLKERLTLEKLKEYIQQNDAFVRGMNHLKMNGCMIGIASNTRRRYIDIILKSLGVDKFVDFSIAGNEIIHPKPDPECYLSVMKKCGIQPENTVIFEDSEVGLTGARHSGAGMVIQVNPDKLVSYDEIVGIM
jgi:HAD superfamily hydrolase (TIGR01509 family)